MRLILTLLIFLSLAADAFVSPAHAQGCGSSNPNCVVPTPPFPDSSNKAANTLWVTAHFGSGSSLPTIGADNLLGNPTASPSNALTGMQLPSCSNANNALSYSTSTHLFGCNTVSGGGGSAGGTNGQIQWNNAGALAGFTMSGDCTTNTSTGAITCTKTNGTNFATSATTDTTNASNITSGSLANARLTTGFVVAGTGLTGGSLAGGATVAPDFSSTANYFAGTASKVLSAAVVYTLEQAQTAATSTVTLDFSTFLNIALTLQTNVTTFTLSNIKAGQVGTIRFIQDASGNRTIPTAFNSNFKCSGGCNYVLSTAANAVDLIPYFCLSTTYCVGGSLIQGLQ
jgi:hypothetical protein